MAEATVFHGTIIHTKSYEEFITIKNGFLAINDSGKIIGIGTDYNEWAKDKGDFVAAAKHVDLSRHQFLMPGLVDCHIHAPQFAQLGLGLDMPLLEWLNKYTFPLEAKFENAEFAQKVYSKVVETTLNNGTTLAAYFGTNNRKSTVILAKEAICQGQRALVGKVCSDSHSPQFYIETTEDSLLETTDFIEEVFKLESPLVQPIITPRFAVSCSKELLYGLGLIAKKHAMHIQSHISENLDEIAFVRRIFSQGYAAVYDSALLLTKKTVLAHGVHLDDSELSLLKQRNTAIAHCPSSNTLLKSGFCDVQRLISNGIKVGLGTDVSGGNSVSIIDAILRALEVSNHLEFIKKQNIQGTGVASKLDLAYKPLDYKQAFFLATLGGADALAMSHLTGNFEEGKQFDALLVDMSVNLPIFGPLGPEELLQKFIYTGDDRNILRVYVAGKCVKGAPLQPV